MKVLLTNHHLVDRAGSELYVAELATALEARGHDARVFTLYPGPVAQQLTERGVPVYTLAEQHLVQAFAPEVVHAHHPPTLWVVGSLALGCPAIVSSLGVLPALEAPTPIWPGVALGVAVSEEVKARVDRSAFGRAVPVRVMRNWFDDRGWAPEPAVPPARVTRVAVVTNHLAPELAQHLDACVRARPGFSWAHLGLPASSVEVTPAVLGAFDLVITIGRTALQAAAVGRPVLLADVYGSDGLLDAARLDALASVNFSGRLERRPLSPGAVVEALEAAPRHDVAAVQARVLRDFRLTTRAAEWEAVYEEVRASPRRLDEAAKHEFEPLGQQYALLVEQGRQAASRAATAEAERDAVAARLRDTEARLAAARGELDAPGVATVLRLTARARELGRDVAPHGSLRRDALVKARWLLGD